MPNVTSPLRNNPLATREDVKDALLQLCNPLLPYYSEGKARLKIGQSSAGYPDATAEMEGFSRVLWGLVPLAAGGGDSVLWDIYLQIRNGTDPLHEEYWGEAGRLDQKLVEMAAFGFALALAPDKVWEPLSEVEQ